MLGQPMRKVAPGQLPSPTTTFVGRQHDLLAVGRWFATGHRLVVIVGPPGMGKTRVAIEYAAQVAESGARGPAVRFCDLTEVRDLDELCAHVAACLGLSLEPGADVAASIGLALREGRDLLVLDNFEQLVDVGAATVAFWLSRAPGAQLLVTSRERLRIDGEAVHELEPLSLPTGPDLTGSEAIALFVDRARQLRRDFALTDSDAPVVAEIVRRLDGIPLAIEVAAARMDVMGPSTLVERMPRRLDLLASGRRDATARQATLRGAIDGSWNALTPPAQSALAQASVFRGGFTLEAAEAVLDLSAHAGAPAIVDVLAGLRAKSLLRAHGPSELPAELRFSLYESIRDYAAEKLAAPGDVAATRARHTQYFIGRFASRERRASKSMRSRFDLVHERDNLIAVLENALAAPATAETTRVAVEVLLAIDPVLPRSGPSEAHLGWLDALLARPPELLGPALRANALLAHGRALLARARFEHSLTSFTDALEMAHQLDDPRLEARALMGIGISHHQRNHDDEAKAPFERALALLRGYDLRRQSVVHGYLGAIDQQAGRMHAARTHYRDALRAIETGSPPNRAFLESTVRLRLAFLALDEGSPADAQLECEQGIVLAIEGRNRRLQGIAYGCLALARWALGQLDEADQLIAGSAEVLAETRDHLNTGVTHSVRGAILAARDRVDEAADAFASADAALAAVGDRSDLSVSAIYHGHLDLARARQAAAAGDAPRALAHRSEAERRLVQGSAGTPRTPARVALRTLRRALETADASDHGPGDDETLEIDRDRRWIRIPGRVRWVRFGRQTVPWRLLLELCEARLRAPGQPISAEALIAAGWPGQSLLPTAAQNRLHVAVNSLRKLGLRQLIVTRDDGYLLTPSVRVRWVVNS
jgi:predicted ATPase